MAEALLYQNYIRSRSLVAESSANLVYAALTHVQETSPQSQAFSSTFLLRQMTALTDYPFLPYRAFSIFVQASGPSNCKRGDKSKADLIVMGPTAKAPLKRSSSAVLRSE